MRLKIPHVFAHIGLPAPESGQYWVPETGFEITLTKGETTPPNRLNKFDYYLLIDKTIHKLR